MSKKALIVIDMQLGNFIGSNPIINGKKLIYEVSNLISRVRDVPDNIIIYIQNNGNEGDPDEPGTIGWEIHPSIKPQFNDIIIQKTSPDAFHNTNLHQELKTRSINELVVAGLQTEYCIDSTCRRAFSLGYSVILVANGHSTWDSKILTAKQIIKHHNSVLSDFFVTLKNQEEVLFV